MGRSPHFGCSRPTTETSRTSGCEASSVREGVSAPTQWLHVETSEGIGELTLFDC